MGGKISSVSTIPGRADPGFLVGGVDLVGGRRLRGGYVSKLLYVEMKESGPLRGRMPPRSANDLDKTFGNTNFLAPTSA